MCTYKRQRHVTLVAGDRMFAIVVGRERVAELQRSGVGGVSGTASTVTDDQIGIEAHFHQTRLKLCRM